MHEVVRFDAVTKVFGGTRALDNLTLSVKPNQIIGLIGTNASGKSTLLRHIVGIYLPTQGEVRTFGTVARDLSSAELSRVGMVHQDEQFLHWMNIAELISYVSAFYPKWDRKRENHLIEALELDRRADVATLSPGKKQRLAIVMATCHHPELLILDEPLSNIDPLAREAILHTLLEIFRDSAPTIIVSSHLLHDVERIVDHVVCLDAGRLVLDEPLDQLQERFAEWIVTSPLATLPARFSEPWILSESGDARRRVLIVSESAAQLESFRNRYAVTIEERRLNLERIFGHVVGRIRIPAARERDDLNTMAGAER